MQKAQRLALAPGNLWSESGRGTNAIGTALAIDDSCEIEGRQHFLISNQGLYCAAVPLQSPDGKIAGCWIFPDRPSTRTPARWPG
jgi:transcriptional regulator of acetoin/glycerol metabolism